MPYNTRRKSLSLPALGIQLPQASRARRESLSKPPTSADAVVAPEVPPAKRVKRSHGAGPPSPVSTPAASPPASAPVKSVSFADRPRTSGRPGVHAHTPPPSPGPSDSKRIDIEGINDDIVVGVIEQLETTGNRPHLIKELATVLSTTNTSVANSANPAALLSSRLAAYMRRPWTALAPCPIAKELIPIHPRKVFYYLTTTPRQEMPTTPSDILKGGQPDGKRIISPSLSNASQDDDEDTSMAEDRKRAALSPSPEIDLTLDLDEIAPLNATGTLPDFPTPGSTLSSSRSSTSREGHESETDRRLNRHAEPEQEGDEREFEETARDMAMRGMSNAMESFNAAAAVDRSGQSTMETEEEGVQKNSEAAHALFGPHHHHHHHHHHHSSGQTHGHLTVASNDGALLSSPTIKPASDVAAHAFVKAESKGIGVHDVAMISTDVETIDGLEMDWEIGRPENMDLDELDDFFDGF